MSDGIDEDVAKPLGARAARQLGAFVGDRDEMIRPPRDAGVFQLLRGNAPPASSARSSCPTCSRAGTACVTGRRGGRADRGRIGRVEHAEPRPARSRADDRSQDLGRQAGSAHPEQHDVGEAARLTPSANVRRRSSESAIRPRRRQPAEPVGDRLLHRRGEAAPGRRLVPPHGARLRVERTGGCCRH